MRSKRILAYPGVHIEVEKPMCEQCDTLSTTHRPPQSPHPTGHL